jgi:hypothetical protein
MGRKDCFVTDWELSKCAWIDKPGKKGKRVQDKRGIIIADASGKAYLTWLQKLCARDRLGTWKDESMGALPGRSTSQALTKVFALRERLRKNKQNSATFLGDAVKAFDRINRAKLLGQVKKKMKHPDLIRRVIARHRTVKVRSTVGEDEVTMVMTTGVPQGCPKGPPLHVTGYEGSPTKSTSPDYRQGMNEYWSPTRSLIQHPPSPFDKPRLTELRLWMTTLKLRH